MKIFLLVAIIGTGLGIGAFFLLSCYRYLLAKVEGAIDAYFEPFEEWDDYDDPSERQSRG